METYARVFAVDIVAITALSITGTIGWILVIISTILLLGYGANLIAGFNTLTK